jgi:uncharacterized protein YcbK (DUF882 family)
MTLAFKIAIQLSVMTGMMVPVMATEWTADEARVLRLLNLSTKESLSLIYKRDARYIGPALEQLNRFMRDWRSNRITSISPALLDLIWELHRDLGSREPIHVLSGYRTAQTNAMLKRMGRAVATHSQHIEGRAIDLRFPDIPLDRLRNAAIARSAGGVGFYPEGKGGFIHIDTAVPRHWPKLPPVEQPKVLQAQAGRDPGQLVTSSPSRASRRHKMAAQSPEVRVLSQKLSKELTLMTNWWEKKL